MSASNNNSVPSTKEDISDYVAHLQVHMSLQSRNLLPLDDDTDTNDASEDLMYQTQVNLEKLASREFA